MSLLTKLALVVAIVLVAIKINSVLQPPPLPKIDENAWWGPGERPSKEDVTIKPFKISVSDELIPILTTPQKDYDFAFEVIAPSLPGFAFSDGAAKTGLGAVQMGAIFKNLMHRLGHEKFYMQGGDWGAVIVSNMATLFPDNILGLHSNMCFAKGTIPTIKILLGSICPSLVVDEEYKHKMYPLLEKLQFNIEENGYFHLQATKPDTVGIAVAQSPAGLAAYILEKFSTLTNATYKSYEDGGLLEKFTYEELIDNLMLYWLINSFTTSVRIYAESFTKVQLTERVVEIPIRKDVPCQEEKGLDDAGKTTILYRFKLGEVVRSNPTILFNVETIKYKNLNFAIWDMGSGPKLWPTFRHYFPREDCAQDLIFVVNSNDREQIETASYELKTLWEHSLSTMRMDASLLVYVNKQDLPDAMNEAEIIEKLGLRSGMAV
ncbi:hypothetical protein ILUMI_27107 [Ignelater luminosus]|uniref:small monomeric GTPase n=1 Tax=Ignelater luminosus TaxID=2038154 RepID=A0A8K0FX31_IGNLU|nr:hypothetical protein ILUMI_27107 [Ignelater luminosus]